ncbi:MAG: ferric reductase-like transmembrane domain-containing protein [Burkholderiaceae bacterium]|nr:ferric reductase-like transmembrane domain-containing protein [Burkholderiaceae bacterium]
MKRIKVSLLAILLLLTALWLAADTLALRPKWLELHLDGLDKMYRLHKWLGVTALAVSVVHNGERIRAAVPEWRSASIWFCGPPRSGEPLPRTNIGKVLRRELRDSALGGAGKAVAPPQPAAGA